MGCLLTSYSGERVGCLTCTQTYGHATLQLAIKGYVYTEKHMADNDKVLCFDEPTYAIYFRSRGYKDIDGDKDNATQGKNGKMCEF